MKAWVLVVGFFFAPSVLLAAGLNGPPAIPSPAKTLELPSLPSWLGQQAVVLFQQVISPADGPRSPSYPTGSAYGRLVLAQEGFFWGVLMIGDRLFHEADVPLGPVVEVYGHRRFYDPPAYNRYWRDGGGP
ncbi:MAG: hypothetical protein RRB13_07980 [bacterium]|nr:hypothetical protein [bacterium]